MDKPWQYVIQMYKDEIAFWIEQGMDKDYPEQFERMQTMLARFEADSEVSE